MRHIFRALSVRWLHIRIPPSQQHQLHRGNIFIFPGVFGFFYLLLTASLFLLAVNYQNNLLLFLCLFLVSLFVVSLFTAYKNISGLHIEAETVKPVFCGENGYMTVKFKRPQFLPVYGQAELYWIGENSRYMIDLTLSKPAHQLPFPTTTRGEIALPRVTFTTAYPLGLIRCWTHLDFKQTLLVYPSQRTQEVNLTQWYTQHGEGNNTQTGTDDFNSLQPWQTGEPLNRVAWKRVAKGGDWQNKVFTEQLNSSGYLDITTIKADTETALQILCWQIQHLSEAGAEYGLKLGSLVLPPATGPNHRSACLRALALHSKGAAP